MGVFDDVLKNNETLFKNEIALDYSFIPKLIPYREKEQHHLANCMKPVLAGRNGRNVLIHGPPGIGKTAACRHLLRELEESDEFSEKVYLFYINCWQKNTTYKVILDMCDIVGYVFTQNKKGDELFKIIANIINKKGAIFVFDEIDKAEDTDFLYMILEDIYKKSIFLITNYKSWLLELDDRIKSRLIPELLEFRQYNENETSGILRERIQYAFIDNIWNDDALSVVVKKAFELKDIRSGLFLIKESALVAEEKGSRKIKKEHVNIALLKLDEFVIKSSLDLDEESQKIFKIIKENSGQKIGDLFKLYQKSGGVQSYKSFQRKIAKLDEGKYISLEKTHGSGGNTTIINKKITDY
ncbi:MAG: AAA family ATPase [Candidatus Woesearchaeota archaeon]